MPIGVHWSALCLEEIKNRWCEEWRLELRLVNPRTAGYSINPWVTSCAIWNLSCIKMHATMLYILNPQKCGGFQQRLKRQKNPPHFISCIPVACNLLHEMMNRWCEEWRLALYLVNPTNGTVFNKSVSDIVCGVESIVHQDARYHALHIKPLKVRWIFQCLKRQKNPPHLMLSSS